MADQPTSPTPTPTPTPIPIPAPELPASMPSQEASQKIRKKEQLFLTDEQQADVMDWLKENIIIYNKHLSEYQNTEKKNKLWADKAKELGVDPIKLQTWVDSMRSQYGRLTPDQVRTGSEGEHREGSIHPGEIQFSKGPYCPPDFPPWCQCEYMFFLKFL